MSLFDVNLVSINEQFNPLISMDMVWANNLTTHWDINRRRDVSLSLVNAQLSETSGNEIVLGLGYRFGNLPIFLKSKQLNNDINVQFDFSIRKKQYHHPKNNRKCRSVDGRGKSDVYQSIRGLYV